MITEEKLAELRKAYPVSPADYGEIIMGKITLLYIFDTLSALWRVARAADNVPDMWKAGDLAYALKQLYALREGKETR